MAVSTPGSCRTLGSSGAASSACNPPPLQSVDTSAHANLETGWQNARHLTSLLQPGQALSSISSFDESPPLLSHLGILQGCQHIAVVVAPAFSKPEPLAPNQVDQMSRCRGQCLRSVTVIAGHVFVDAQMSAQQLPPDSVLKEGRRQGAALPQTGHTHTPVQSSPNVNARLSAKATSACCRRLGRKAGRLPNARRTAIPVQASSPRPAAAFSAAFRSTAGMHSRGGSSAVCHTKCILGVRPFETAALALELPLYLAIAESSCFSLQQS